MKHQSIEIISDGGKCTGCYACVNACPVKCIHMELNIEGFYSPVIEKDKCISCGKCLKICPTTVDVGMHQKKTNEWKCVAAHADDGVRVKSSSGGVFSLLAKAILDSGGCVFGAYYDSESKCVKHGSTDNIDFELLMRSKYSQSMVGNVYTEVLECLANNRKVLFVGTPCQITALAKLASSYISNLYLVDFACHGVPSPGLLKDYLDSIERDRQDKIIDVSFREKDLGWRTQQLKVYFESGKILANHQNADPFYYLFLNNISLNTSCYTCAYQTGSVSDICLMDFWGCKKDDNQGISACVLKSEKALELWNKVECTLEYTEEIDFSQIRHNFLPHDIQGSYKRRKKDRDKFYQYYVKHGFNKTFKQCYPYIKRKIAFLRKISQFYIWGGKIKRLIKR